MYNNGGAFGAIPAATFNDSSNYLYLDPVRLILGGSASYFAVAASFLAPVRMVAVTGSDFPAGEREFLASRGIDLDGLVEGEEGCLSVPQLYGQVTRAEQIVVDAFDLEGQGFQYELDELPGRVVQHETDHLDGGMFFDRMSDAGRKQLEPQLDEFETIFRHRQATGECLSDEALRGLLEELQEQSVPG